MINRDSILYALDDICIIPAAISGIRHRSKCNPFVDANNTKLPIFTAPMDAVVDDTNWKKFYDQGITPIIPRTVSLDKRMELAINEHLWIAVGLNEFEEYFTADSKYDLPSAYCVRVLIDIANGNMSHLIEVIGKAKNYALNNGFTIRIMAGNVANPETYKMLAKSGVWGVRVSVGSGACCITTSNTGVHYPMASLIDECSTIKKTYGCKTRIIADGGISNYSRAIKALALGADYVMIGTAFVKSQESAAEICKNYNDGALYKKMYGMSTKEAQKKIDPNAKLHTSEGIHRMVKVEYTLAQWVDNFKDYLKSAMSYCGVRNLYDFRTKTICGVMSPTAQSVINK